MHSLRVASVSYRGESPRARTATSGSPNRAVTRSEKSATSGTITEYPIPTASSAPGDIAAGPDGNLWFTENLVGKIGKISPSGTFTEYPIPSVNPHPYAIAAGPDGNLWFTETKTVNNFGVRAIGKITTSGAFTEYSLPGFGA